jgi:hypothetical protein
MLRDCCYKTQPTKSYTSSKELNKSGDDEMFVLIAKIETLWRGGHFSYARHFDSKADILQKQSR